MTRDEAVRERTVERFLECEAKRAEARAAALAEGKSEGEAREIAHEAAKEHWNAWAEELLAERKALEETGAWTAEKKYPWKSLEPNITVAILSEDGPFRRRPDAPFARGTRR